MRRNDHQIFMNPPGLNSPASCNRADCIGNGESLAPVCLCVCIYRELKGKLLAIADVFLRVRFPLTSPLYSFRLDIKSCGAGLVEF